MDVFVPGGMPQHTYIQRKQGNLEERLHSTQNNLCKLVTVTGGTKSGKTVLVNKVFPKTTSIWVDGGHVKIEDDIWNSVLEQIGGRTQIETHSKESTRSTDGKLFEGKGEVPFVFKGGMEVNESISKETERERVEGLSFSPRAAAVSQIRKSKKSLIIDDFHYLDRHVQGDVIRALKPLIFDGIPVIIIAIPHRRYDAVKVEREMTGRIESIDILPWGTDELIAIPNEGFPLLNIGIDNKLCIKLAEEAYGSPYIMQEFCRQLASDKVEKTSERKITIPSIQNNLFIKVAEGTGKVVFDKLAKGPRQRADRKQRTLKTGGTVDIYQATLLAMAQLLQEEPSLQTIEYEKLRLAIRNLLLKDSVPQAQEITRVLKEMEEIASKDESSIPVIDLEADERKIHITDPFFAFYLKWGVPLKK